MRELKTTCNYHDNLPITMETTYTSPLAWRALCGTWGKQDPTAVWGANIVDITHDQPSPLALFLSKGSQKFITHFLLIVYSREFLHS